LVSGQRDLRRPGRGAPLRALSVPRAFGARRDGESLQGPVPADATPDGEVSRGPLPDRRRSSGYSRQFLCCISRNRKRRPLLMFSLPSLAVRREDDETIVRFIDLDRLDEYNSEVAGQQLCRLAERLSRTRLVLDLTSIRFMTSSGLGKLVALNRKM